jgi:hypothetical protein
MALQEEKIHDYRIRGTPEIGRRHTTPSPACVHAGQVSGMVLTVPKVGSGLRRGRATEPLEPKGRRLLDLQELLANPFAFVGSSKEAFGWHKNEKTSHRLMAT